MKIAVLGTGMVGEALATQLAGLGHQVTTGARSATNEKAREWAEKTVRWRRGRRRVSVQLHQGRCEPRSARRRRGPESARQGAGGRLQPPRLLQGDAAHANGR